MRKDGRRCEASLLKKVSGDWGSVLSSHDRKGGNCKRMNGGGKGKSENRDLKLESIMEWETVHY